MDHQPDGLRRLAMEVLGLAFVSAMAIVIAAFHVFGETSAEAQRALVFSLSTLGLATLPVLLFVAWRVSGLEQLNRHLLSRATRDGLTQVLNKETFQSAVEAETAQARQRRDETVLNTLLVIDADHLRQIADQFGQATGNAALVAISRVLTRSVRKDDIVGRTSSEEFGVLLKGAGLEEARVVAERLRSAVAGLAVGPRSRSARLSVSTGGLTFAGPVAYEALYRAADANLYRARKNGRNRVELTSSVVPARPRLGATAALAGKAG